MLIERPNEGVSVAIFCSGDRRLGFEDGVNATHWMGSGRTFFNGFVLRTSVGDFCGYLEQIVVPDVSVSFRHLLSVVALRDAFSSGLMVVEKGGRRTMAQSAIFWFGCWEEASRPDCEGGAGGPDVLCSREGSWSRKEL